MAGMISVGTRDARVCTSNIRRLRRPGGTAEIEEALTAFSGRVQRSVFQHASPECPAFYAADCGNEGFVFIDGTSTWQQALKQCRGFTGVTPVIIDDPRSPANTDAAAIIDASVTDMLVGCRDVLIGGWSWGGAIASHYAYLLWARCVSFRQIGLSIQTFGAPRIAGAPTCRLFDATAQVTRWMHHDDPIPLMPPNAIESPALAFVAGPWSSRRMNNFRHPGGGFQIGEQGYEGVAYTPSGPDASLIQSLLAYYSDIELDNALAHDIVHYDELLTRWSPPTEMPEVVPPQVIEEQPVIMPLTIDRQITQSTIALQTLQGNRLEVPEVLPKNLLLEKVKHNDVWHILFGGVVVAHEVNKKAAKHLVKIGNDFLKALVHSPVTDTASLTEQMILFFQIATDANGPVKPTMNEQVPAQ